MLKVIKLINFDKYQHYKGEHMVWCKLYVKLLHDVKFMSLSEQERWVFIALLLLASSSNNSIDYNPEFIEKIINTSNIDNSINRLISIKFIELVYKKSNKIHIEKKREDKRREDNTKLPAYAEKKAKEEAEAIIKRIREAKRK